MRYSVGKVARLAGVTVRTLHHYDETGLLHPSGRLDSGYRSYSADDLERLQRILCYRQLGFPLEKINALLDDPSADPLEHLRRQHALLSERITALQHMVAMVEKMMEARTLGMNLDPHEMLEVFGDTDPFAHCEEAEQRWGGSDAWTQSQRRISTCTKDDWKRMRAEFAALMTDVAAAHSRGLAPDALRPMDLAEAHRAYLERWFYDCSYGMHRGLGDLYVNDPRFAATFAAFAPELAPFLRNAIHANAARNAK